MRVLQINVVYKSGSTGKIVASLHNYLLQKGIESFVLYGRGFSSNDSNTIKICSNLFARWHKLSSFFLGNMYGGNSLSTRKAIRAIKKINPDVIHLHCLNGDFVNIYKLLSWIRTNNISTIMTLHAEFMFTGNCSHSFECEQWKKGCADCPRPFRSSRRPFKATVSRAWNKMRKAFDGFEKLSVVSVSPWLMARAEESSILAKFKHYYIGNGVDCSLFHRYSQSKLENKQIVLHVSPNFDNNINNIKGGVFFAELAKTYIDTDIEFWVVGNYKKSQHYPKNIKFLGRIDDQKELARVYSEASVTVLTSKRETFSLVAAESLCCGTPVIGFKAGAPETIAIDAYSKFVTYGDLKELKQCLDLFLTKSFEREEISRDAIELYSSEKMCSSYLELYKRNQ